MEALPKKQAKSIWEPNVHLLFPSKQGDAIRASINGVEVTMRTDEGQWPRLNAVMRCSSVTTRRVPANPKLISKALRRAIKASTEPRRDLQVEFVYDGFTGYLQPLGSNTARIGLPNIEFPIEDRFAVAVDPMLKVLSGLSEEASMELSPDGGPIHFRDGADTSLLTRTS